MGFPPDANVFEGENIIFRAEVTGTPQPTLTWYHNGDEVEVDYSRQLADDGSLTLPSVEARHTGTYKMVAQNPAGKREREVKLVVNTESTKEVQRTQPHLEGTAIPIAVFGNHVERNHNKQNKRFKDEYQASQSWVCR